MKKLKYEKEYLNEIIKNNLSIAGVCRDLNIRPHGGNYRTIKFYISEFNLDISHFTGQGWNVGTRYIQVYKARPLSEILVENSTYTNTNNLKNRLIKEQYLKYICDECKITEWNNKPLTLHLDHINGNNRDNRLENLRLLCPNCHSQTPTYCNRKITDNVSNYRMDMFNKYKNKPKEYNYCECGKIIKENETKCKACLRKEIKEINKHRCGCGKEISKDNKTGLCKKCLSKSIRKVERPPYEQLIKEIKETNYTQVGRKYGVSDNAIRKWKKNYEKD